MSWASGGIAAAPLELDLTLTLDGSMVATESELRDGSYAYHNSRKPDVVYGWRETSVRLGRAPRVAAASGIGFVLAYLAYTCGREVNVNGYFFNDSLNI